MIISKNVQMSFIIIYNYATVIDMLQSVRHHIILQVLENEKTFIQKRGGSNPVGDYDFQTPVFFFQKYLKFLMKEMEINVINNEIFTKL